MLVTASSAVLALGRSMAGSGGGFPRCDVLYSSADVESSMGGGGFGTCSASENLRGVEDRLRTAVIALALLASVRTRNTAKLAMIPPDIRSVGESAEGQATPGGECFDLFLQWATQEESRRGGARGLRITDPATCPNAAAVGSGR